MAARKRKGFTLIELLVVIGVLAVVLSIVFIAVNPAEQLNRANDVSAKATANEFIKASMQEYTVSKSLPWDSDSACQAEMESGETLADMPACIHALINDEKLESNFKESSKLNEFFVTKCGKSAVICYSPKSKVEYEQVEAKYNKFGVSQPGCPGKGGSSEQCYWCRPIHNDSSCLIDLTPTPTALPTDAPTVTPTLAPTATTAPTATPTPPYLIAGYALDDPKFFRTYAILSYTPPPFGPNWMVDVSMRPDFGGTSSSGFGYFVNGVPVTSDADTIFNVAYAGDGNFGTLTSPSYAAQITLTEKRFAFISMPYYWSQYVNGCGKNIYWRLVGWPGASQSGLIGPTQTSVIDCTTKVGVEHYMNHYVPLIDYNTDGVIDWKDSIIRSLLTKSRAGGWQPPE